jgi:predicted nucleotidyltransferase
MGENGHHILIAITRSGLELDMNHKERVEACREVSQRLLRKYYHDIVATAVVGSVARMDDLEHSDIDFQVLVREGSTLRTHTFILNNCLFSVNVRTESDWRRELTEGGDHLPLAIGSLMTILPAHDPTGSFARLKNIALNVPVEAWKNGVREGISGIFEDFGRLRNLFEGQNWDAFRMMRGFVAAEMALTYANLRRKVLRSEKDLVSVFETDGAVQTEEARAFRVAAGLEPAEDAYVMEALEFLEGFLVREAMKQSTMPLMVKSGRTYVAP